LFAGGGYLASDADGSTARCHQMNGWFCDLNTVFGGFLIGIGAVAEVVGLAVLMKSFDRSAEVPANLPDYLYLRP
jgi:hypothetical protein